MTVEIIISALLVLLAAFNTILLAVSWSRFVIGSFHNTLKWMVLCYAGFTAEIVLIALTSFAPAIKSIIEIPSTIAIFVTLISGTLFTISLFLFAAEYGFAPRLDGRKSK